MFFLLPQQRASVPLKAANVGVSMPITPFHPQVPGVSPPVAFTGKSITNAHNQGVSLLMTVY